MSTVCEVSDLSHAQDRAFSRYGVKLSTNEFLELRRQITEGEAEKVHKKSKNIGVYICKIYGTRLIVVYHRGKKFFITVLPWAYLEEVTKKYNYREVFR